MIWLDLEEPAYTADCWGAMSVVVEDIKANGQEAYVPSCACEYKDMALTKTVRADWAAENPDIAAFISKLIRYLQKKLMKC